MECKTVRQYSTCNRAPWVFVMLLSMSVFIGCGGDDGGGMEPPPPPSHVEQGWTVFESGDFNNAALRFQEAINNDPGNANAHDGLGWANMKLGNLSEALTNFDNALSNGFTGADPHAGQAIVYRDIEPVDYTLAISAANTALTVDANYQFAHDPELNHLDLHLILAQSKFAIGDYMAANNEVAALGGNVQNPVSETFVEDLLAEIERLGELIGS